jgi:hypothetical protein
MASTDARGSNGDSPTFSTARFLPRWVIAIWVVLAVTLLLAWSAARLRSGLPLAPRSMLIALGADVAFAAIVATWLYRCARRWAACHLKLPRVAVRVIALTDLTLLGVYLGLGAYLVIRGVETSEIVARLTDSPSTAAADWSFLLAIAMSVVPIPFLRTKAPQARILPRGSKFARPVRSSMSMRVK